MALSEQELERIGILASRVLDGEATDAECADLARLRSDYPEVRELCADLDAGHAALGLGVGSAPLPDGFAQKISYRAMQEPRGTSVGAGRVHVLWGAAATGAAAAAAALWFLLGGGTAGDAPTPDRHNLTAKDGTRSTPDRRNPNTPGNPSGGTDALFPKRDRATAPEQPDGPTPPSEQPAQPNSAPQPPAPPHKGTVVETPVLPKQGPSLPAQPEHPAVPAQPQPAPLTATAVMVASFDQLEGRSLTLMPGEGAEWATVGSDDLAHTPINAGSTLRASEGSVSLALHQGGFAALDRGAEVGFDRPAADRAMRLRVNKGHVFMDLDERAAAMTADCGIATVELEPGSRVALDVSANEVGVTVIEGHAIVLGNQEGAEPKRVGRHTGVKVNRQGRTGSVSKRAPRMRTHERRFLERRFQRAGAELFGHKSRWGGASAQIDRQSRDLLAQGTTPREMMPLLMKAQKMGYEGPDAVVLLRALELAKKQGLGREQCGMGLRRVMMRQLRGKEFESALARWLQHPEGDGRPDRPGKGARGRDGRKGGAAGKPFKPEKPEKGEKSPHKNGKGAKQGMSGNRRG